MTLGPFTATPVTRWTHDLLNAGFLQIGNKAERPASSSRSNRMIYFAEDTREILWSNGTSTGNDLGDGWGYLIYADGAVDIPSLRSLGSGSLQGAPGNHGHLRSGDILGEYLNSGGNTALFSTTIPANSHIDILPYTWAYSPRDVMFIDWWIRFLNDQSIIPSIFINNVQYSQSVQGISEYASTHDQRGPNHTIVYISDLATSISFFVRLTNNTSNSITVDTTRYKIKLARAKENIT